MGRSVCRRPGGTGWWRDYWLAASERQGHPVRIGYVTDQPDAWLTAIANGYGIALAPESAARCYARPGITYRPVTGVSPSQAAAWPCGADTDPVVQDFVRCCLDNKPLRLAITTRWKRQPTAPDTLAATAIGLPPAGSSAGSSQ